MNPFRWLTRPNRHWDTPNWFVLLTNVIAGLIVFGLIVAANIALAVVIWLGLRIFTSIDDPLLADGLSWVVLAMWAVIWNVQRR